MAPFTEFRVSVAARRADPSTGAVAQLGERVVRNDEAVGSIPISSTFCNRSNLEERPDSKSEPGLSDFKAAEESGGVSFRSWFYGRVQGTLIEE